MPWISSWLKRTGWNVQAELLLHTNWELNQQLLGSWVGMWKHVHWYTTYIYGHFLDVSYMENHRRKIHSLTAARWISSVKTNDKHECQILLGGNCLCKLLYSSSALAEIKWSSIGTYTAKVSSLTSWFITGHSPIKYVSLFWCFKDMSLINHPLAFVVFNLPWHVMLTMLFKLSICTLFPSVNKAF